MIILRGVFMLLKGVFHLSKIFKFLLTGFIKFLKIPLIFIRFVSQLVTKTKTAGSGKVSGYINKLDGLNSKGHTLHDNGLNKIKNRIDVSLIDKIDRIRRGIDIKHDEAAKWIRNPNNFGKFGQTDLGQKVGKLTGKLVENKRAIYSGMTQTMSDKQRERFPHIYSVPPAAPGTEAYKEWQKNVEKSKKGGGIPWGFVILIIAIILVVLYFVFQDEVDELVDDAIEEYTSEESGGEEGGSTLILPQWEEREITEYIDNCGYTVKDMFYDRNTQEYLVRVHGATDLSTGEESSIELVTGGDIEREANNMIFHYGKMGGKYRSPILKVVKDDHGVKEELTDHYMKVYIVKKSLDEEKMAQGIRMYNPSKIYINMEIIKKWRADLGEDEDNNEIWPSGPIIHEKVDIKSGIIKKIMKNNTGISEEEQINLYRSLDSMNLDELKIAATDTYGLDEVTLLEELVNNELYEHNYVNSSPDSDDIIREECITEEDKISLLDPSFKIYFGLVFTNGISYHESFDYESDNFKITNVCANPITAMENPTICLNTDGIIYTNIVDPLINDGLGLNDIFNRGFQQFDECPPRLAETNVVFGLHRFSNTDKSEQSLDKYDEIVSNRLISGGYGYNGSSLKYTDELNPYINHLCELPNTISGLSDKEIYCASMIEGDNCKSYETFEGGIISKQCYERYPKVVVIKLISNLHRTPIVQVSKIDNTNPTKGIISELVVVDNGYNDDDPSENPFLFYIMRKPDDKIEVEISPTYDNIDDVKELIEDAADGDQGSGIIYVDNFDNTRGLSDIERDASI